MSSLSARNRAFPLRSSTSTDAAEIESCRRGGIGDARLEVVKLHALIEVSTGTLEEIDSDEAALAPVAVQIHVAALHEPHIAVEPVGLAFVVARRPLDLGGVDYPSKSVIVDISRPSIGGITWMNGSLGRVEKSGAKPPGMGRGSPSVLRAEAAGGM